MNRYDYMEHLKEDIRNFIEEDDLWGEDIDELYDRLWMEDSVTGNASGSYTFSTWEAEENICHNWEIILEMLDEEFISPRTMESPESIDVSIRCYLLYRALDEVLEEHENE